MTDFYVLDRTARTIAGPMTEAAADAAADATHTKSSDLGYLQDLKNQLDDAAAGGGGGGVDLDAIQAALDDGTLVAPGGGGGGATALLNHHTQVADQTVAVADIPTTGSGFPATLPTTDSPLWRISGPGVFGVGVHFEVNQLGTDDDYFNITLIGETSEGGSISTSLGDARVDRTPTDGIDADWTRYHQWIGAGLFYLAPGQYIDYSVTINGHDQSVDLDTPVSADVQFRNFHVWALKLDPVMAGSADNLTLEQVQAALDDGSLVAPVEDWQAPTDLAATFTPDPTAPLAFRKDSMNKVTLRGAVDVVSVFSWGDTLFTLPPGYRPQQRVELFTPYHETFGGGADMFIRLNINTDGTVKLITQIGGAVSAGADSRLILDDVDFYSD